jgi:hypothetical protein
VPTASLPVSPLKNILLAITDQITTGPQTLEPSLSICPRNHNFLATISAFIAPSGPTTLFYGPSICKHTSQTFTSALCAQDNSSVNLPSDVILIEPIKPITTPPIELPSYKWKESSTSQNIEPPLCPYMGKPLKEISKLSSKHWKIGGTPKWNKSGLKPLPDILLGELAITPSTSVSSRHKPITSSRGQTHKPTDIHPLTIPDGWTTSITTLQNISDSLIGEMNFASEPVTIMDVPFPIFSLPILSHLIPSPSITFSYVPHLSVTFRTSLLLSRSHSYMIPSAAVLL